MSTKIKEQEGKYRRVAINFLGLRNYFEIKAGL